MLDAVNQLQQFVSAIHPFTDSEWQEFVEIWKPVSAKRKEQLTMVGQQEHYLYFVAQGVQRVYYFDDAMREATLVFTYAPSFGGVLDSMLNGTPSKYSYETLTQSVLLKADFRTLQHIALTNKAVSALIQKGCYAALAGVLERLVEVQCFSSEQRFKTLLERSPHLLQLIPHKYIANYLGIDATNFSKLINKIKI